MDIYTDFIELPVRARADSNPRRPPGATGAVRRPFLQRIVRRPSVVVAVRTGRCANLEAFYADSRQSIKRAARATGAEVSATT